MNIIAETALPTAWKTSAELFIQQITEFQFGSDLGTALNFWFWMYVAILQIEIAFAPNHERIRFPSQILGIFEHTRSGRFILSQKVDDISFHELVTILLKLFWLALFSVYEMFDFNGSLTVTCNVFCLCAVHACCADVSAGILSHAQH